MKKCVKRRICAALLVLLPFLCNIKSYAYFRDRIERDTMDYIRYANENPDLYASYGYDRDKLYEHYINSGKEEGRLAHCLYNRPDRQSIYMWGVERGKSGYGTLCERESRCCGSDRYESGSAEDAFSGARTAGKQKRLRSSL